MPEPVTVAMVGGPAWTEEQLDAVERRSGDLLLDAAAGSGKTSVLVERFVRAVLEDGVEVGAILTITFTEKAAAEMRDRIRGRLRELGAVREARATEGASISTIHGFCARLLRAHALAAGIDPAFEVLDEQRAQRLADSAFDDALEELAAGGPDGVELIAAYAPGLLRGSIQSVFAELRSRGELEPALPALAPAPDLEALRRAVIASASTAALELGSIADPSVRVIQALERLERCAGVVGDADPWPGDLDTMRLPNGNGAALCTEACVAYGEALERFREACGRRRAGRAHEQLGRLLSRYGALYAARKREASGLDFEDLELMARELLRGDADLRERYRARFTHLMVDELQDTNGVQLDLIEMVADGNLFTVGDAQQSIYGFRHADVELFQRRGARLDEVGGRMALSTNFRSRPEIIEVLNHVFAGALEGFRPLRAGRRDPRAPDPRVELLVADKGVDWTPDGVASPWRVAEARALARRVGELIAAGSAPGEIVVLTRATTDLRAYERALEERGIPTYVIGGRGYWGHPQVVDLVGYLRALANPRDEEALYTVLASPLVGVSVDALVMLADAGRASGRDPWWVLRSPDGLLDELGEEDRGRLARFAGWFAGERALGARVGIDELIGRALERTGYDLAVLAMPGGRRRLANVRKLTR
ncbi:MAG: UvrD-helicase domain-containing protein, partial [Solirubrobacterales bacterium]|nr:UvrD-helicase domain-containing protein [Solirubrobacterales bacterium]